jgi:hypothetical protein
MGPISQSVKTYHTLKKLNKQTVLTDTATQEADRHTHCTLYCLAGPLTWSIQDFSGHELLLLYYHGNVSVVDISNRQIRHMEEVQCLIIGLLLGYCESTNYSYWLVNNFHWFLLQMEL